MLTRVEESIGARLQRSGPGLAGVVGAYAHGLANALDADRAFFPDLKIPRSAEMSDRGLQAISEVERLFREAAEQHRAEVKHRDAGAAIDIAGRVITSTCLRACARRDRPDQAAWARLADELAAMAMAYLQPGQWHGRPSSAIDIGRDVGHPGVMDGTLMVGRNVRRFRQERQFSDRAGRPLRWPPIVLGFRLS